jgi:NAD-dependent SIR2 family protein deacetylase
MMTEEKKMSKTQKVKCPNCSNTFPDNPEKHQHRNKLCPYCLFPYKKTGLQWKMPTISFKGIKKTLQKIYRFFPKDESKKGVVYICPNPACDYRAFNEKELFFQQFPDKTKNIMVKGQPKTIVLSYRLLPHCPKCRSGLIRKTFTDKGNA